MDDIAASQGLFFYPEKGGGSETLPPLSAMTAHNATTSRERIRKHLVQALTRAESDAVQQHLQAALKEWENRPPTPLQECPVCGKIGLPERIRIHECNRSIQR